MSSCGGRKDVGCCVNGIFKNEKKNNLGIEDLLITNPLLALDEGYQREERQCVDRNLSPLLGLKSNLRRGIMLFESSRNILLEFALTMSFISSPPSLLSYSLIL